MLSSKAKLKRHLSDSHGGMKLTAHRRLSSGGGFALMPHRPFYVCLECGERMLHAGEKISRHLTSRHALTLTAYYLKHKDNVDKEVAEKAARDAKNLKVRKLMEKMIEVDMEKPKVSKAKAAQSKLQLLQQPIQSPPPPSQTPPPPESASEEAETVLAPSREEAPLLMPRVFGKELSTVAAKFYKENGVWRVRPKRRESWNMAPPKSPSSPAGTVNRLGEPVLFDKSSR